MASPFTFFRKYSGGMMIVMVILSMLLFTLTDLFSDPSRNLWLLGLLVGGAVFAVAGLGQGRWLQWGLGGAVLGTVLGYILPGFVSESGLSTRLGVIDETAIQDLELRRAIANQVMIRATEECFGEGTGRFATLFGFGHGSREDVIFGKLMRAEADRLGIEVSDEMVGDYLKRATNDKLTQESYLRIRDGLGYRGQPLTNDQLNEILADEIKGRMAWQILRPQSTTSPTPEVFWEYYRRLNVRQQIGVASLEVDEFTDQVGEPSDAEVAQLFAEYRRKFPNEEDPGAPGFRLPFRAKLAYLELDSEQIEKGLPEVTDEDVQKYYDDNKETPLIRTQVLPDSDDADSKDDDAPDEQEKPEAAAKEADEAKSTDETAAEKKEAGKEGEPKAAADSEKPAETKEKSPEAKDGQSNDEKPADQEKASESEVETPAEEAKEAAPAKESAADEAPPEKATPSEETETNTPTPVADEETEPAPAEESEGDTDPSADGAESAKEETEAGDDAQESQSPAPKPLIVPAAPSEEETAETPEIQYEYRELDDELKKDIRETIQRERTEEKIDEILTKAATFMKSLARERGREHFSKIEADPQKYDVRSPGYQDALKELRESLKPLNEDLAKRLKEYAKENGLAYVETPLMSYGEFLDSEDYPIGVATEPNDNPMAAASSSSVALTVFQGFSNDEQNNDGQLYQPAKAELKAATLDGTASHYVYWVTDFSPSHIPTLDEPGVREMVVTAWQRQKARELVTERAEELAELVRKGLAAEGDDQQDMASALKDKTVTGEEDSASIAVRKSLPFSWLRTSSASPMSFQQQQASQSPITFDDTIGGQLEKVGGDFMKEIFGGMNDEEVKVVPNFDHSAYLIVHVTNRFPTPEIGEDSLKDRFATEGQQFAFAQSPILSVMQQEIAAPANVEWERSVWLKYGVDPDSEPDE